MKGTPLSNKAKCDPESISAINNRVSRGKLTIFLGAAAGVGKTYAMLEAAQERVQEGYDVAVGWIDTHGRKETNSLLDDLETIPPRKIEYQGSIVQEMDIDEILKRRPHIVLVDKLSHTNLEGSRHQRRFLDVEEILDSGIDVYTTFNIQNVESLNDTVALITGIHVIETVPDRFLETADQIKLVDIPAEELIRRLRDGKVFVPELDEQALHRFYRPGNINALRELAMRYAARRVGMQLEEYRTQRGINQSWPVQERIMACISNSPFAVHVLRRARQIANDLNAELITVHVESPFSSPSAKALEHLGKNLQLADDLGTKVLITSSSNVSSGILNLAQKYNVSQIVLGKPLRPRWREMLRGSVVEDIIRGSGGIGVYLVSGDPLPEVLTLNEIKRTSPREKSGYSLILSLFLVGLVTLIGRVYGDYLGLTNMGMLYLLPVVFASARLGMVPSILVAVTSVLLFDIFLIPPILQLTVYDVRHLITFGVFLVVAITTGNMAERLRLRMREAVYRETRTRALYDLARSLSAVTDLNLLAGKVVNHVSENLDAEVVLYLPEAGGNLKAAAASKAFSDLVLGPNELAVAEWAFQHSQRCGIGTDTLPRSKGFYLPVKTDEKVLGVLGVKPIKQLFAPEQITLLEALTGLAALAIGRLVLAAEAQEIKNLEESERLRAALFNSLSHDMKTPLASILGAVSSLVDDGDMYDADQKITLLTSIKQGALRMNRVIGNLLNMARLESGYMRLHTDWCDIQDIIGVTLRENQEILQDHQVKVETPDTIRLIKVDYGLIEQVLTNLLHNAVKYSPLQSEILVRVIEEHDQLMVSVADHGEGIPTADEERIFDKFYRLQSPMNVSGTGLGLSICRGIIEAHGGRIWSRNRPGGGSKLIFTLPIDDASPRSGESR